MFENNPEISERRFIVPIQNGVIFLDQPNNAKLYYNVCIRPTNPMQDELAFYFDLSFDEDMIPGKGIYINDIENISVFANRFRDWDFYEMIDLFNYKNKGS